MIDSPLDVGQPVPELVCIWVLVLPLKSSAHKNIDLLVKDKIHDTHGGQKEREDYNVLIFSSLYRLALYACIFFSVPQRRGHQLFVRAGFVLRSLLGIVILFYPVY